jgi:Flp pilus assembly CpaE family ATPase
LIAANLAAVLAQRNQSVGLLDLHLRGGDLATLLKCQPRHTLASLAAKKEQLDQSMFEQSLVKHECGMQILTSPEPFSDFRSIRPELILKVVQLARQSFGYIVVDLEDCEHDEQIRVLAASERIVLVVRPDFVSVHRARKCLEFLTRAKVAREHVSPVVNRVGQPKALGINLIEDVLGMHVASRLPDEPDAVNVSVNLGVPLVIACPQAKISQGIAALAHELTGVESNSPKLGWAGRQLNRLKSVVAHGPGRTG